MKKKKANMNKLTKKKSPREHTLDGAEQNKLFKAVTRYTILQS